MFIEQQIGFGFDSLQMLTSVVISNCNNISQNTVFTVCQINSDLGSIINFFQKHKQNLPDNFWTVV